MSNPEWHDEKGKFKGKAGPGRPRGVPEFEAVMRKMLRDNADEFGAVMHQLLLDGDAKAWDLMTRRAFPEPPKELDLTSDGGPVSFGWRAPASPTAPAPEPEPEPEADETTEGEAP